MDSQTNKNFYNDAMYNGTILGAVWSITYLLLFAGATNMLSMFLCLTLYIASPFIAARLAVNYRYKKCDNTMSFAQAWVFILYMYICATLLSTLTTYIYFSFFDNGTFLATLQKMLEESMSIAGTDEQLIKQIEQTKNIIDNTTSSNFVWQIMSNNLTNTTIIPIIIALFVKRKDK